MKRHFKITAIIVLLIAACPMALFAMTLNEGWNLLAPNSDQAVRATLLTENDKYIEVEWNISKFQSTTIATPEGDFQRLSFSNIPNVSREDLGEPELPLAVEMMRYPTGCYGWVEILSNDWISFENVKPYPVQYPLRDGEEERPFEFDPKAYQSTESIPLQIAGVSTPKGWGGLEVSSLWVSPFKYVASEQRLDVATKIRIRVWFERDDRFHAIASRSPSIWQLKAAHANLINPPNDPPIVDDADEPEPFRLLVVTREAALQTAQPLIDLHENTGLKADVWVLQGDDEVTPEEIKDRIRDMYAEGLQYVLFVGDGDTLTPDIPMEYWDTAYPGAELDEPTKCGSDSWYTCLDDQDRDGIDDHLPDIALGRLVYDNVNALAQLQVQVDKLTDYIAWQFQDQNSDWLRSGLLIAHRQNDAGHDYIPCKQTIADADYEFPHPEWVFLPGNVQASTNARVIQEMNDGKGIVNYRGHGDMTRWYSWNTRGETFTPAKVAELENRQRPFILFSSACETGDIFRYRGTCLMEAFQKHSNGGSLCANGCTMTTFTLGNSYSDIAVFDALYEQGIYNIGYANNAAMAASVLYFDANPPGGVYRGIGYLNMRSYLWLGDASVNYRMGDPAQISIEGPAMVPEGTRHIDVQVMVGDEPFEDALIVARTPDDEVYALAITDGQGRATVTFDAPLEQQQSLLVTASHRESKIASLPILVANGLGVIEGQVIRHSDDQPIMGVNVTLSEFGVIEVTDDAGLFRMEGIPSGQYQLNAAIDGLIPGVLNIQVVENQVADAQFSLTRSEMTLDLELIDVTVSTESDSSISLDFSNQGDGDLSWSVNFQPDVRHEPMDPVFEFFPGWENGDSNLNGGVFIDDKFYVAGGNDAQDPNFIYVFDRNGQELVDERLTQPVDGIGFRDLEWDGEYLYGAASSEIKVMNLEAEVVETIPGPQGMAVSRAIAVDPDGNLWVGNNLDQITKINRDGDVLRRFPVNLYVQGLAWYSAGANGYNLLVWGRGPTTGAELWSANPETGQMTLMTRLGQQDRDSAVEGLYVTNQYDSRDWMAIAMILEEGMRTLKLIELAPRTDWIEIDPTQGEVAVGRDSQISINLNAFECTEGTVFGGNALFTTNNLNEVIELPIQVTVGPNSVRDDLASNAPTDFAISRIYPNPFNARLNLNISLPASGDLTIGLYDLQGRLVLRENLRSLSIGTHSITIDGENLANGLYLIKAESQGRSAVGKAALLK